jgi:hypothetical protein
MHLVQFIYFTADGGAATSHAQEKALLRFPRP